MAYEMPVVPEGILCSVSPGHWGVTITFKYPGFLKYGFTLAQLIISHVFLVLYTEPKWMT